MLRKLDVERDFQVEDDKRRGGGEVVKTLAIKLS